MESGRPVETDVAKKLRAGELVTVWPNVLGSKNWFHASFNPLTNFLYTNTQNYSTTYRLAKLDKYVPGQRWVGTADLKHNIADSEVKGYLEAIDPMSGKAKWQIPFNDTPNWSSVMTTAGGLLFTGRHNGEFMAVDVDTGKVLWKFKTSSGINAQPITWTQNGKQYVTVLSGLGGLGAVRTISAEQIKTIPRGGSVWTFALPN
jgi:alcohol dehydrogenase (cytochrome c)